jgi:hypothetical protein
MELFFSKRPPHSIGQQPNLPTSLESILSKRSGYGIRKAPQSTHARLAGGEHLPRSDRDEPSMTRGPFESDTLHWQLNFRQFVSPSYVSPFAVANSCIEI